MVGLGEPLAAAVAFVVSSLVLYNGRAVAFAGPLLPETSCWAMERVLGDCSDEVVVDLSWSINNPTLRVRDELKPCRNNWQASLDLVVGGKRRRDWRRVSGREGKLWLLPCIEVSVRCGL